MQVLRESSFEILEVSRTGRMAMRRGHHTSRVLKALGTPGSQPFSAGSGEDEADYAIKPDEDEFIANQFPEVHEEEQ